MCRTKHKGRCTLPPDVLAASVERTALWLLLKFGCPLIWRHGATHLRCRTVSLTMQLLGRASLICSICCTSSYRLRRLPGIYGCCDCWWYESSRRYICQSSMRGTMLHRVHWLWLGMMASAAKELLLHEDLPISGYVAAKILAT